MKYEYEAVQSRISQRITRRQSRQEAAQERRDTRQARLVGRNVLLQLNRGYTKLPAKKFPILFGNPELKSATSDVEEAPARLNSRVSELLISQLAEKNIEISIHSPESEYRHDMIHVDSIDGKPL